MKDKSRAADQDVFGVVKVPFDTTDLPYQSTGDATAVALARADRYRLPAGDRPGGAPAPSRSSTASTWACRSTSTSPSPPRPRHRCRACPHRPRRHPVLVGARRAHRLAGRARSRWRRSTEHGLWETRAVPALQAARRRRRRRPRRRPAARLRRCAARSTSGVLSAVDTVTWRTAGRHAVQRAGLPAGLLRRSVPRLAGHARRGRRGLHHQPRQRAPGRRPLGRRRPLLERRRHHAPHAPSRARPSSTCTRRSTRAGRPAARRLRLPALHPRLLPDRALRRGAARRAAGRSAARATATSRCGRGGRRSGAPTTRRSPSPTASPSRSTWWRRAGPTTCGSREVGDADALGVLRRLRRRRDRRAGDRHATSASADGVSQGFDVTYDLADRGPPARSRGRGRSPSTAPRCRCTAPTATTTPSAPRRSATPRSPSRTARRPSRSTSSRGNAEQQPAAPEPRPRARRPCVRCRLGTR